MKRDFWWERGLVIVETNRKETGGWAEDLSQEDFIQPSPPGSSGASFYFSQRTQAQWVDTAWSLRFCLLG